MDKFKSFLNYALIFAVTFLLIQSFTGKPKEDVNIPNEGEFTIETAKSNYAVGKDIKVNVNYTSSEELILPASCPDIPFRVLKFNGESYTEVNEPLKMNCEKAADIVIKPNKKNTISLLDHSYTLFGEEGLYKLELDVEDKTYVTPEFNIKRPSIITRVWRTAIYNPILNALVAIVIYLPGHQLALAIIGLTLVIRTILLVPSIKAIRAQKRMQEVQPKLEKLKEKYKDDQSKLAQETMLLWKSHKVHPLSSCTPLLIQFPILIALFYVVSGGLSPDKAILIYEFLPEFHLADINSQFLMFDLLERSLIVFPVAIGSLQFIQMQLMTMKNKKKKEGKKDAKKSAGNEMEQANQMMKYVMPVMIAVFASQLPAAVGLYWGTSTFYGILQQLVVNKEGPNNSSTKSKDGVTVKVINKSHGKTN